MGFPQGIGCSKTSAAEDMKDELAAWRVRVHVFSQALKACAFGMDDNDQVNQFLQ
jgi:hypothetical protein